MREHPEAESPEQQALVERVAKKMEVKVAEADQLYDKFRRFIDEA
ncbi:MAG: hypothetical protein ACR2FJ_00710 [Qipengyuania sp.]